MGEFELMLGNQFNPGYPISRRNIMKTMQRKKQCSVMASIKKKRQLEEAEQFIEEDCGVDEDFLTDTDDNEDWEDGEWQGY